jgi:hypothetical protein
MIGKETLPLRVKKDHILLEHGKSQKMRGVPHLL